MDIITLYYEIYRSMEARKKTLIIIIYYVSKILIIAPYYFWKAEQKYIIQLNIPVGPTSSLHKIPTTRVQQNLTWEHNWKLSKLEVGIDQFL